MTVVVLGDEVQVLVGSAAVQVVEVLQGAPGRDGVDGAGASFRLTFTAANLSIYGLLPINHNLGVIPHSITFYDDNGDEFEPDGITDVTATSAIANLESWIGFSGTYTVAIGG